MTLVEQLVALMLCAILIVAAVGSYRASISGASQLSQYAERGDLERHIIELLRDDLQLIEMGSDACKLVTDMQQNGIDEQIVLQLCSTANPLEDERSAVEQIAYSIKESKTDDGVRVRKLIRRSRPAYTAHPQVWKALELAQDVRNFSIQKISEHTLVRATLTRSVDADVTTVSAVLPLGFVAVTAGVAKEKAADGSTQNQEIDQKNGAEQNNEASNGS